MELDTLLARARALPKDKQTRVAAVLGAVVADAAAQPTHWIYDDGVLKEVLKGHDQPEFLPQSANPFYRLATGSQSFYGDHLMVTLRSLVECKGVNIAHFKEATYKSVGPGSPYDHPGQDKKVYPMEGKYLASTMKAFIKSYNIEGGSGTTDVDSYNLCIVPPLVAMYASHPNLIKHMNTSATIFQANPVSLATTLAACRLIEQYIQGAEHALENVLKELSLPTRQQSRTADQEVFEHIEAALQNKDLSISAATQKFGKGCYFPGPFQSAVHALLNDHGYTSTVREVITAGGNSCVRLMVVGACLGAKYGLDSIPVTWMEKTNAAKEALELSLALVELSTE